MMQSRSKTCNRSKKNIVRPVQLLLGTILFCIVKSYWNTFDVIFQIFFALEILARPLARLNKVCRFFSLLAWQQKEYFEAQFFPIKAQL